MALSRQVEPFQLSFVKPRNTVWIETRKYERVNNGLSDRSTQLMQSLENVLCSSQNAKFRELVYRWVKWARYKFPAQSQYIFTWHQYASSLTQMSVSSSSRIKGKVNGMVRYDPYMNCFYNAELLSTILKLETCGGRGSKPFWRISMFSFRFLSSTLFKYLISDLLWRHQNENTA